MRPSILRESGQLFHETSDFDVQPAIATSTRKVLCIGHAVEKRLLCWPLMLTICIAAGAAVGAAYMTCSVATGAEVGSFVGVVFSLSWAYALWVAG
jgi:hypothetical protein